MSDIKAARIHAYGGPDSVVIDKIAMPAHAENQVVVEMRAAGVNGFDWKTRDGILKDAFPRPFPIGLGIELAGKVVAVGSKVDWLHAGDEVFGPMGGLGSYAEYVAVDAANLTAKPAALNDNQAAAIPIGGLAAWQSLFEAGELKAGQRVLINGGAGGVGSFAVQFAHRAGAYVIATASKDNADYVHKLGADEVVDYRTRFEDTVHGIDLVLDLVGGNTLDRLWTVLAETGRIITTAAPDIGARTPHGRHGQWFMMHPDAKQLAHIAQQVLKGEVHVEIGRTFALDAAASAIEHNKNGHTRGKTIITFPSRAP